MALADGSFYYPRTRVYDRPENHGLQYEEVRFASTDGVTLHGWFFPASRPRGTVVHAHGNAGNITAHFSFVHWLPARGWNVLCFDYREYGCSTGRVNRRGTVDDTIEAIRYAQQRPDVRADRVCLLGQSMGGSVSIVAATECPDLAPLAGLCIDGAFSSYRIEAHFVARRTWYLWAIAPLVARYLVSDDLSPITFAPRLPPIPKLFIAGTQDRIVDYRQTVELYHAATEPKRLWVIEDSDHTEAITGLIEGGRERVLAFLDSCVSDTSP